MINLTCTLRGSPKEHHGLDVYARERQPRVQAHDQSLVPSLYCDGVPQLATKEKKIYSKIVRYDDKSYNRSDLCQII